MVALQRRRSGPRPGDGEGRSRHHEASAETPEGARHQCRLEAAQTIAFVSLCTFELIRAYTARSEYHSVFAIGVFSNKWMNWAVLASFLLVLMVVYVPFLNPFFDTVPLTLDDWLLMLPFFFASPIAMELVKLYFRRRTATARAIA